MGKQTITQRSFIIGEPREEFLEADDLDLRLASLRRAENVRIKATRTIDQKLGSWFRRLLASDLPIFEVRPNFGEVYAVEIRSTGVAIWDVQGNQVFTSSAYSLGDVTKVWVEDFGKNIVIGAPTGLYTLTYTASSVWSLAPFSFAAAPGGQLAQPYWSFVQNITMTPSALTGAITVTASAPIFTSDYVGQRIRYNYREILITAVTSATVASGTVVSELPPTFRLTLASVTGFAVGDAVIGLDTGFEGQIVAKGASTIDVITLRFLGGPDVNEQISAPSATSTLTARTTISPAASVVWDEPLISPARGYPQAGAAASGRLILIDFPQAPDVIAASSVREIFDFLIGDEDDDAIVRAVGDNSPRFLHVVNAGDLLLLSDRGIYMVELRSNTALTPASFVPRLVDGRGASTVKPAQVDDGVIFVEASGEALAVALLDGNIYLKWSVRTISTFHAHLIQSPVALCGPPEASPLPEKYLFVVNADGTLAVMSWVDGFDPENVGFVKWTTQGSYKRVTKLFGGYWATTFRNVAGVDRFLLEEFAEGVYVDCASSIDGGVGGLINSIFNGQSLAVCGENWYAGLASPAGGVIAGTFPEGGQAGWNYLSYVGLWPQEQINHPKAGMIPARVIRASFSVLHTGPFAIRCNKITQRFGGYSFGDPLDQQPPPKTRIYRCSVIGRRDHPEIEAIKETPGLFQILAASQEVTF